MPRSAARDGEGIEPVKVNLLRRKSMGKIKINVWKLIPALLAGARAGVEAVGAATSADSDGGTKVTKKEAGDIADAIGKAVGAKVLETLLDRKA